MRAPRMVRALLRALVVVAVVAVPAVAAETVVTAVSGGRFVTLEGKRVPSVKVFFTNGVIQKDVLTQSRVSKVVVKADGGIKCGAEWPHIAVEVNGAPVMSAFVEGVNRTLEAPVSLPAGTHQVRVRFDNDYFEPSNAFTGTPRPPLTCDRNLLLDSLELVATGDTTTPPTTPPPAPPPPNPPPPTPPPANQSDILWTGDAERAWDDSLESRRWPDNNEWVSYSCQDRSRFSQVTSPVAQGERAYRIEVRDGDDSYGERCELDNGNTSSSRLHEDILFHRGQEVWIAFQTYLPPDFSFAEDGAPVSFPGDGGLLMQLKQLGSCGTPGARHRDRQGPVRDAQQRRQQLRVGIDEVVVVGADGAGPLGALAGPREVRDGPGGRVHRHLVRPGRPGPAPDRAPPGPRQAGRGEPDLHAYAEVADRPPQPGLPRG